MKDMNEQMVQTNLNPCTWCFDLTPVKEEVVSETSTLFVHPHPFSI